MIKNILVPLTGFENDARALETAYQVGLPFGAHLACLRVQPDPMQIVARAASQQFGTTMGNTEMLHALQKDVGARTKKAKDAYDALCSERGLSQTPTSGNAVSASWTHVEGDPLRDTVVAARYCELFVLARAPKDGEPSADAMAAMLVGCGRPMLIAADRPAKTIGTTIAVAWKETAEAARAVTAAMPLLARAKRVVVLSATETPSEGLSQDRRAERLAMQLARHGIAVEGRDIAPAGQSASDALLEAASAAGADLVVMGAYSHSRLRELVFGGFTRQVMQACDLPVLLQH